MIDATIGTGQKPGGNFGNGDVIRLANVRFFFLFLLQSTSPLRRNLIASISIHDGVHISVDYVIIAKLGRSGYTLRHEVEKW